MRRLYTAKNYRVHWDNVSDIDTDMFLHIYNLFLDILPDNYDKVFLDDEDFYESKNVYLESKTFNALVDVISKSSYKKYLEYNKTNESIYTLSEEQYKEIKVVFKNILRQYDKTNEYIVISYF